MFLVGSVRLKDPCWMAEKFVSRCFLHIVPVKRVDSNGGDER